jgi:hypothetical protein
MDTKELLNKIAKIKNAIESESDPDVKKAFQKRVDALEKQIAEAEVKVEKVEAKAAAEEKKELNEAEQKIQKLKAALANESDPDVKEKFQKRIKQLEDSLKDVKQEIKEEKKEIAEQKKDIKAATKEVKSAQKEVRKTAIKKVAAKQVERKQVVTRKAKRKTKIKTIISDLDKLIDKNKELKAKYKGKGVDLKKDAGRSAKPFGYRFVGKHDYRVPTEAQVRKGLKRGTIDYEARPNRSDKYPKGQKSSYAKLADGGNVKDSAVVAIVTAQKFDTKSKEFVGKERVDNIKKGNEIFADAFKRHTPFAESTQEKLVKNAYEEYWNDGKSDEVIKVKKVEITADGRKPHHYEDGGMMSHGGMSQGYDDREDERLAMKHGKMADKDLHSTHARRDDARFEERMARGGAVKKKVASKSNPKPSKKVGKSIQDKHRFAKPAGWRWKEEAFEKRIIERKQLAMSPSKKMRDKYPDLVYFEDRLNKADAKPTRTSADSI